MALFGNRSLREGPGVYKYDAEKTGFFRYWDILFKKFTRIIGATLLYVVCCLPVFTIGLATAGYSYIMRNFVRGEPVSIISDFFTVIKKNWEQSLVAGIVDVVVIVSYVANYLFYSDFQEGNLFYLFWAVSVFYLVYFIMRFYIYDLIITFDYKIVSVYKNAFYLAVLGIKKNLLTLLSIVSLTLAYIGLIWLILSTFPVQMTELIIFYIIVLSMFIPIALFSVAIQMNSWSVIEKLIVEPYNEKNPTEKIAEEQIFTDTVVPEKKSKNSKTGNNN